MADVKISELNEADLPLDGTEDTVIVQNATTKRVSTQDIADLAVGFKSYHARLTQSGTGNPTATVLMNTLSGAITWTRLGAGLYSGTLTGQFTLNKTAVLTSNKNTSLVEGYAVNVNTVEVDQVQRSDGSSADSLDIFIEVRVYN